MRLLLGKSRLSFGAWIAVGLSTNALGATWTVDDDAPADFTNVTAAQAVAQPGDLLLIMPGTYPAFTLTKRLTLLGPVQGARPSFQGSSLVTAVGGFGLAGLAFQSLRVQGVQGTGVVDDCALGPPPSLWSSVELTDCVDLRFSRCEIKGRDYASYLFGAPAAVNQLDSRVQWTASSVVGGHGDSIGDGQDALRVTNGFALVSGSSLTGGSGGSPGLCTSCGWDGADAIQALNAVLRIRGAGEHLQQGYGAGSGPLAGDDGFGLDLTGTTAVVSGIVPPTTRTVNSTIVSPALAEPFLRIDGSDVPGENRRLKLFGPASAQAFIFLSFAATKQPSSALGLPLWVLPSDPFFVVPMIATGELDPQTWLLPIPSIPTAIGVTAWFQAVFPGISDALAPQKLATTNAVPLILRF